MIKINSNFIKLKNKVNQTNTADLNLNFHKYLSSNTVTGMSLNFPIGSTCKPSKVCIQTCYGLNGPITWPVSIKKQMRNEFLCKKSPKQFAIQIRSEIKKYLYKDKNFFLRWNGVGDLFKEAVDAIFELATLEPNLPIWVVTRIPEHAARLANNNLPNVFIHFSLDSKSITRKVQVEKLISNKKNNLFFSYQCDSNEIYNPIKNISVVFADKYNNNFIKTIDETICPLNTSSNIIGICNKCRRCFNGDAVKYKQNNN